VTCALWARRKSLPAGLAAWGCYVALVFPVLGVVVTGFQVAADRYSYLAMMPAAVVAAAGLEKLFRSGRAAPRPVSAALAGVLILLSLATARQTEVWKDSITLWTQELRFDPDCSLAYNSRGAERQDRGDSQEAIEDCTKALSLNPSLADPYLNRGLARVRLGELDEAIRDFDAYLRLAPRSAKGYQSRGVARLQKRDLAGALADLDEALKLAGPKAEVYVARGRVRAAGGDLKGAAEEFDAALRIAPGDWPLRQETQHLRDIARRQAGGR